MIGAPGGNPGLKLPVNFLDGRRIIDGPVDLNFQELPGMALRAFNSHLSSMFHNLWLIFQRITSLLAPERESVADQSSFYSPCFFLSSPSTTSASITSASPLP